MFPITTVSVLLIVPLVSHQDKRHTSKDASSKKDEKHEKCK
jgi:hypothetical protein